MIKAVIIDDEPRNIKLMKNMLSEFCPQVHLIGEANNANDGKSLIRQSKPDLVFLDIEMPYGNGFDLINDLMPVDFEVIFVTAFDKYMLQALKYSALDYLLKPVQKEDLASAINKYKNMKEMYVAGNGNGDVNMQQLIHELQQKLQPKEYRKRFLVKNGQKLVSIESEEIAYFFSDGRLNFFKTYDNRKFIVDYTMDELEDMLDPQRYFRISRSFYISVDSVDQIHDYFGNRLLLYLKPVVDKEAVVSREKVTDFKKWMGK